MLLRAIFLCIAVAVAGETMLQAAASLAIAAFHRQGVTAATDAFGDAVAQAQSAIATAMANGALPSAAPSAAPACAVADATGCALVTNESIAFATPVPAVCPSLGCAGYAQGNDAVSEGRVVASITTTATTASGTVVATRSGSVVFRTLRVPPYAIASGAIDATLDDALSAGDAGGIAPEAASPGTLIDVLYENATSGATMPANVWDGMSATAPAVSGWSP